MLPQIAQEIAHWLFQRGQKSTAYNLGKILNQKFSNFESPIVLKIPIEQWLTFSQNFTQSGRAIRHINSTKIFRVHKGDVVRIYSHFHTKCIHPPQGWKRATDVHPSSGAIPFISMSISGQTPEKLFFGNLHVVVGNCWFYATNVAKDSVAQNVRISWYYLVD